MRFKKREILFQTIKKVYLTVEKEFKLCNNNNQYQVNII
jgi:hypothetical protein